MPFDPGTLGLLARTVEVEIETYSAAAVHRTVIWIVVDDRDVFVRSVNGSAARWYREATADPSVAIHAAGERIPARAVPAVDQASVARTTAGLERKYAVSPSLPSMLREEVLGTTLRLDPA